MIEEGMFVIGAIRDVTERKLADEQIKKLNDVLELTLRRSEKLASTGRLVAPIAHEMDNFTFLHQEDRSCRRTL